MQRLNLKTPVGIGVLLGILGLLAFGQVYDFGYINYDDPYWITGNSIVQKGLTWEGIRWSFTSTRLGDDVAYEEIGYLAPVAFISHMVMVELFGLDAGPHHLANVFLHIIDSILFFWILNRMTKRLWESAAVAFLFAFHPLHVESVAWVTERKDVLGFLFWLLALASWNRFIDGKGRRWKYLSVGCFVLCVSTKPMLVSFPCLLMLFDIWPYRRISLTPISTLLAEMKNRVGEKIPFFIVSSYFSLLTFGSSDRQGHLGGLSEYSFWFRIKNVLISYVSYLRKIVWPSDLVLPYPVPPSIEWWHALGAGILLLGITLIAWRRRVSAPWLLVGWFWYLGVLVPAIGFIQVGIYSMGDRYTYVSLIGVFIMLVWQIGKVARERKKAQVMGFLGGVLGFACWWACWNQTALWRDSETLFIHALKYSQGNAIAHNNLGAVWMDQGRWKEAEEQFRAAMRVGPHPSFHYNLAHALEKMGRLDDSVEEYYRAMGLLSEKDPDRVLLTWNLMRQGDRYFEKNQIDLAFQRYLLASRIKPNMMDPVLRMGVLLHRQGNIPKALVQFREATRLDPQQSQAFHALAWILATHPDVAYRNGVEAEKCALEACRLSNGKEAVYLYTLAAAYAENGKFKEALEAAVQAHDLAVSKKQMKVAQDIERGMEDLRMGKAIRETRSTKLDQ